ncbi:MULTISPECIES: SIR2 family protein [unclassified Lysinibacillus]|uniref:SIR2 family protein n=1 Tax=unclassified Lysinibacillus TaxID=2636778 RepID=UPI003805A8D1
MSEEKFLYHLRTGVNQLDRLSFKDQKGRIKKVLNECLMSKNLNILIGSGCSVPAVPLMGVTFKKIKEENPDLILGKFCGDSSDIEGYLNWLNTGMKFLQDSASEFEIASELEKYKKSFEVTKKTLLKSIPREYDELNQMQVDVKRNYIKFYNTIFSVRGTKNYSPPNIFTTNYDLFNEVAMEKLAIHYTNGFRGHVKKVFDPTVFQLRLVDDQHRYKEKWSVIRNYVKLYKIHGSIDWHFNDTRVIQKSSDDDIDNVVIYPTIDKHLETQQTPYSELFRALTISLQKPDSTLLVLGYGFPDQHINQLISQALSNEDFTLIIFGNREEENAGAFLKEFQDKKNLHFIGGTINNKNDGHHFLNVINYIVGDTDE